jgi:tripartite-type tricarboxylate transporter receptor subunit TctC
MTAEWLRPNIRKITDRPGARGEHITPRSLVKIMSEELKQPVVVVNRPGAAAVVGTLEMERAVPDGYTIGTYSYSQTLTNFTAPNPPHLANITPIAKVMYSPATLTVTANFPANPWRSSSTQRRIGEAVPTWRGPGPHLCEAFD